MVKYKLTPQKVEAFWQYMVTHYDTTVLQKNDDLNKIIGTAADFSLDALKTVGTEIYLIGLFLDKIDMLDVQKFMTRYTTTLGDRIYIPFKIGDEATHIHSLTAQVKICVHEHQHVLQYRKEPCAFVIRYLSDRAQRAIYEAEAFRCNMEIDAFLTGKTPRATGYADNLKDYGCNDHDIMVVEKALRLAKQTIDAGGITTPTGKVAISWLRKNFTGIVW